MLLRVTGRGVEWSLVGSWCNVSLKNLQIVCLQVSHFGDRAPAQIRVVSIVQIVTSNMGLASGQIKSARQLIGKRLFVQICILMRKGDRLIIIFSGFSFVSQYAGAFRL